MTESDEVGIAGGGGSDCENKIFKRLLFKNLNGAAGYLTLKPRLAFTQLKKTFIKALILQHFDLEYYNQIKTDASGYAISRVLSQLVLDNLGW